MPVEFFPPLRIFIGLEERQGGELGPPQIFFFFPPQSQFLSLHGVRLFESCYLLLKDSGDGLRWTVRCVGRIVST